MRTAPRDDSQGAVRRGREAVDLVEASRPTLVSLAKFAYEIYGLITKDTLSR